MPTRDIEPYSGPATVILDDEEISVQVSINVYGMYVKDDPFATDIG